MENITSHGGKTVFKTLREYRLFGSLVLMALAAPLLFGCGGGGGETAFVEEPVVSLASGPEVTLAPDGSGIVSVVLDRPAPRNITVGILNSNNPNQFTVPGSVRVGKGQSSAQFTVTALTGAEGASMSLSLTAGRGYSLGTSTTLTVSVGAEFLPQVSLGGGDTTLSPGTSTSYALLLDQRLSQDLTVSLLTVGDSDQFVIPATVTIPAGETATNFTVSAPTAALLGTSIQVSVLAGAGHAVGAPSSATVSVVADALPQVTLGGTAGELAPGESRTYTLVLNQPTTADVVVNLSVSGDTDAFSVPASVAIEPGDSSASFTLSAQGTAPTGAAIQLNVVAGTGYTVGTPSTTTVTVGTGLLPQAQLAGGNTNLSPGSSTSYAVVLDRAAPAEITVQVLTTGLAGLTISPVVIDAGERSTSFTVTAAANAAEGARQLLLVAGDDYVLGTPSSVTVTVGPGTVPQVSLVGGDSVLSPDSSTVYAVVLNQPAAAAVAVSLSVAGDVGQFSVDPLVVVIPEGESSGTFELSAPASAPIGATVQLSLVAGTGYTVSSPFSAMARVGDGIRPVVRIEGGNRSLAPGQVTTYALVVNQVASTQTVVSLLTAGDVDQFTVPSTVVIPAGAAGANFEVAASLGASEGNIQIFIVSGPDYLVGTPQNVTVNVSGTAVFDLFEGTGSDVVPFEVTAGGAVTFETRHRGGGVFFVELLDQDASLISFLVIESGDADATVVRNLDPGSYLLGITAGGDWSIRITQSAGAGPGPQPAPEVSFLVGGVELAPGTTTQYAVILDRPAVGDVAVNLVASGQTNQISTPGTVTIPSGASSAVFDVEASLSASLGSQVTLSLTAGTGYTLGSPSQATVTVVDGATRPVVRLEGGNKSLTPGQSTVYALVLNQPVAANVQVTLATVGDISEFVVPGTVTVPAGQSAVNFDIAALPAATTGEIDVFIVPGPGYLVGTPQTVTVNVSGVGDPVVPVDSVVLLTSSPDFPSSGSEPVTLTAFVRDANNTLIEGARVVFNATQGDGTLLVTRSETDATGTAQAELSVGNNKLNRNITVFATSSDRQGEVNVRVTGTTFALVAGRTSGSVGDVVTLFIALRDSESKGVAGERLNVSFPQGALLSDANPETDSNGLVTVELLLGAESGELTIETSRPAASGSVSRSFPISVSTDNFAFVVPAPPHDPRPEIELNAVQPLTVSWIDAATGDPISGRNVTFTTTRGDFVDGDVKMTNVDGEATATIQAGTAGAGPAVITATATAGDGSTLTAELVILFIATEVRSMTLQADPAVLAPNQSSTIIAVLRDSPPGEAGNRVKGKRVDFSLTDVTGGSLSATSAVSDEFGRAVITYTAGSTSSAQNGVTISAEILDEPTLVDQPVQVSLSVARRSLFITLGTGNVMEKPDEVRYRKPYGVLVTDSSGNPVGNVDVTLEIWPTHYYKGRWVRQFFGLDFERWVPVIGTAEDFDRLADARPGEALRCPNLDGDRDGISDGPVLIPGNAVTLSTLNVTTNATGFADFDVLYFQQFAQWLDVELTARARVDGTESRDQAFFRLPILAADVTDEDIEPPGNPSPFGTGLSCP